MFVIHHFCLKDIYMSYKHYVTYICCVILNNIQILFQASRTCIHIHEWIVFGHLLLRITIQWHHLDSTLRREARGSSLFWWDFSSSDFGLLRSNPRAACFLFQMYGCVNVCVCTYSPTSIGSLFLFSFCFQLFPRLWLHLPRRLVLNFTQGSSVTTGDLIQNLESAHTKYLCVQLRLILHFEVSVSVTTEFPVNWPQCQRPWKHPILEESSLRSCPSFDDCHLKVVFASSTISLNFSYWACWTVETHRMWIPSRTRSRIRRLLWRAWKKSFGPVTSIP